MYTGFIAMMDDHNDYKADSLTDSLHTMFAEKSDFTRWLYDLKGSRPNLYVTFRDYISSSYHANFDGKSLKVGGVTTARLRVQLRMKWCAAFLLS